MIVLRVQCRMNRGIPLAATPRREPAWYNTPQVGAPVHRSVQKSYEDFFVKCAHTALGLLPQTVLLLCVLTCALRS